MRFASPIRHLHEFAAQATPSNPTPDAVRPGASTGTRAQAPQVEYLPYGPAEADTETICEIVGSYGAFEAEYAAIRQNAALMDCPHRGTLRIRGKDRIPFLNRMVTQELKGTKPGDVRASFWLNRKGRIESDLLLVECGDSMLADVDVHAAERTVESLQTFLFSEDVEIESATAEISRFELHGPSALALLSGTIPAIGRLAPGTCASGNLDDMTLTVARWDSTGEPGFILFVQRTHAEAMWTRFLGQSIGKKRVRAAGWLAYNTARIEAGTPLFNVDFGVTNLPHETGILRERVSFTKGCYLGQEVVARMESLGQPKQVLVGLSFKDDVLPVAESQVFSISPEGMGPQVGVVTSSTISPMLGAKPIAFAMVRTAAAVTDTDVLVNAEGRQVRATIGPLRTLPRRGDSRGEH